MSKNLRRQDTKSNVMVSIVKNYSFQSLEEKTEAEFETDTYYHAPKVITNIKGRKELSRIDMKIE